MALAAAVAALVASARRTSRGPAPSAEPEYLFACWGAAEEIGELRELVIDPINAADEGFRIHLMPIPSDYHTKLSTMIAGGTAPDFFYLSQEYVAAYAAQGALLDLSPMVAGDADPVTDLEEYYPEILRPFRIDGRLLGLPWIAQPVIVYCNVELFRRAGVALPRDDWRWEDFASTAEALTADTDGDGRTDQWGFVLNGWPPVQIWIWQNGAELMDLQTGRVNLDDSEVLEAADFYAGLIHRRRVAPPLSVVSEMGFSELFRMGKVGMFMGGAADDLDRIAGLEVATAVVPAGPTGRRATFAWTAGLHISSGVKDTAKAFEAYKHILEGIQHWKVPAPRRSLAARLEQIEPRKADAAEVIRASMEFMRVPQSHVRQIEFDTLFWEEFEDKLLREGVPARELAERAKAILEDLL